MVIGGARYNQELPVCIAGTIKMTVPCRHLRSKAANSVLDSWMHDSRVSQRTFCCKKHQNIVYRSIHFDGSFQKGCFVMAVFRRAVSSVFRRAASSVFSLGMLRQGLPENQGIRWWCSDTTASRKRRNLVHFRCIMSSAKLRHTFLLLQLKSK